MASEKQVNILMQLLDEALGEVDAIEGKLLSYEEMLQSVKDQMDQISQSNRIIQISNTNNEKLLDEIQFLVVRKCREALGLSKSKQNTCWAIQKKLIPQGIHNTRF